MPTTFTFWHFKIRVARFLGGGVSLELQGTCGFFKGPSRSSEKMPNWVTQKAPKPVIEEYKKNKSIFCKIWKECLLLWKGLHISYFAKGSIINPFLVFCITLRLHSNAAVSTIISNQFTFFTATTTIPISKNSEKTLFYHKTLLLLEKCPAASPTLVVVTWFVDIFDLTDYRTNTFGKKYIKYLLCIHCKIDHGIHHSVWHCHEIKHQIDMSRPWPSRYSLVQKCTDEIQMVWKPT